MSTWWKRASVAERLEQIDAGIALGMTERQIAMNLRVQPYASNPKGSPVGTFARHHGRRFNGDLVRRNHSAAGRAGGLASAKRRGCQNIEIRNAFSIFNTAAPPSMLDEVAYEEA